MASAPKAVERLAHDWERMLAYYAFPQEHWRHVRTTNIIESPFAAVRLRTTAAKRFKKVENATALIWKALLVVEQHFRKLNAPHLCTTVYDGTETLDGSANLFGYGYGPGYKGLVCTLLLSKTGVKLGISRGSELSDPKDLMQGSGKVHRHVQLRTRDDLNQPGLKPLLKAALAAWKKRNENNG
jgi:hypothetical protein